MKRNDKKPGYQSASSQQLEFDVNDLQTKRFTLSNMVNAKLNKLAYHMDRLTHSDVVWLARVEEFFSLNEYITERQSKVLDSILTRHEKQTPTNNFKGFST